MPTQQTSSPASKSKEAGGQVLAGRIELPNAPAELARQGRHVEGRAVIHSLTRSSRSGGRPDHLPRHAGRLPSGMGGRRSLVGNTKVELAHAVSHVHYSRLLCSAAALTGMHPEQRLLVKNIPNLQPLTAPVSLFYPAGAGVRKHLARSSRNGGGNMRVIRPAEPLPAHHNGPKGWRLGRACCRTCTTTSWLPGVS